MRAVFWGFFGGLILTLASCGGPTTPKGGLDDPPPTEEGLPAVRELQTDTYKLYRGKIAGPTAGEYSSYEVYLPLDYATWEKAGRRIAVYTHGYTDPIDFPVGGYADGTKYLSGGRQPYPNEVNKALQSLQQLLVINGYAVAWSSYSRPGYAVQSGVDSTGKLVDIADNHAKSFYAQAAAGFLSKTRVVLGHSLGGIIAAAIAETQPASRVSGVLAMCGPVNGMPDQVQFAGDLRALYDYYFQSNYRSAAFHVPVRPGGEGQPATNPAADQKLRELGWAILGKGDASRKDAFFEFGNYRYYGLAKAIAEALVNGGDLSRARALADTDQVSLPYSNDGELVHSIVDALFYPVRGASNALATAGGSPFNNASTTYTRSGVADAELNSPSGGVLRYAPAPAAAAYVAANYDTTGEINSYVLTLHTTGDPQVLFRHEARYAAKVSARGRGDRLAQQHVNRYGHCSMNFAETANALSALVTWIESGGVKRPATGDVTVNLP